MRHDVWHHRLEDFHRLEIPLRDASQKMRIHVMRNFHIQILNIAGDIEVAAIVQDFLSSGKMAVARYILTGQVGIDNPRNIPLPQMVGLALFHEAARGVNHQHRLAQCPVLF